MHRLLRLSLPLFVLLAACKKDGTVNAPVVDPKVHVYTRLGMGELSLENDTISVSDADPDAAFTYGITGVNGLKVTGDSIVTGSGKMDATGAYSFTIHNAIFRKYKDGELKVKITFTATGKTLEATMLKEEYLIRNYTDFLGMDASVGDEYPDEIYVQAEDFSFPKDTVLTRSPYSGSFGNTYDGQYHKITNLNIEIPKNTSNTNNELLGLFAQLTTGAVVKSVRLELGSKGIIANNSGSAGGIAAVNNGGSIITCSVKGDIQRVLVDPATFVFMGGVAGKCSGGSIIACSHTGAVIGTMAAGIVAMAYDAMIAMCYESGVIETIYGGGIVGKVDPSDGGPTVKIYDSYVYLTNTIYDAGFSSVCPVFTNAYPFNCFSNGLKSQDDVVTYTTAAELNDLLSPIKVANLPEGITAPADGNVYKAAVDPTQPKILWWE